MTATTTDPDYVLRMLQLTAKYGVRDQIDWWGGVPASNVTFVIEIGELFEPGLVDHVPVGPSDVDSFERALVDVGLASEGDFTFGPALYACRLRGMRPRSGAYPADSRVHRLFDAAGRERPGLTDLPPTRPDAVVDLIDVALSPVESDGWPQIPETLLKADPAGPQGQQ